MLPAFTRDKSGQIFLREGIRYVKGRYLTPASSQNPITIANAPSTTTPSYSPPVILEGQEDAVTEIFSLSKLHAAGNTVDSQALLKCKITDSTFRRDLMSGYIPVDHVFGTNVRPFKLPKSILLEPKQTLQVSFQENAAGASDDATVYQAMETRIFQRPAWNLPEVKSRILELRQEAPFFYPYWLTSEAEVTIPASGNATAFFYVNKNIHFLCLGHMVRALINNTYSVALAAPYSVDIYDPSTGRLMNTSPVTTRALGGSAEFPHWYPTGWLIEADSKIRLSFNSLTAAGPMSMYWTFFGIAISADQPSAMVY